MICTVSKAGDPMFELTNDQRKCFGLDLVQHHWQRMEAKVSPHHDFKTKFISGDLRNPKYRNELAKIKKQFGL
jgi:hypothetical protein